MTVPVTTIPKGRPDHPSLDFDLLRAEGIKHLENLATALWTDFNAHDPGITMLELLCYAITDLGYRTRMIPVADILTPKNPNQKTWFDAIAVLPNAPVTERDFRKLLIDVKGVKNAWLRKAEPKEIVMMLYRTGWLLPKLMNEEFKWDQSKVEELLKKLLTSYDAKDYPKYQKCLTDYLRSLERNPKLIDYQTLIDEVKIEIIDRADRIKVKKLQGLAALKHLELKGFFAKQSGFLNADLEITAQNAEYYLDLYKEPTDEFPPFPTEWADLTDKYKAYDLNAYDSNNFKRLHRSFQLAGLNTAVTDEDYADYSIIDNDDKILQGLLLEFDKDVFEDITDIGSIKQLVTVFFNEPQNRDLYQKDGLLIARINGYLENKKATLLTNDQKDLITAYTEGLEKVITKADFETIIRYLDQKGDDTPIRQALHNLYWIILPKSGANPVWSDIEKVEFEENIKSSTGNKKVKKSALSKAAADAIDFDDFIQIVTLDLPERTDIKVHSNALLSSYAPTINNKVEHKLSKIALSTFLYDAFRLDQDSPLIPQLLIELDRKDDIICKVLIAYIQDHFCAYGVNGLTLDRREAHEFYPDPIALNGIYHITLDMDDTVNTANPKAVEEVVNRAMKRLHENRALCEDFLQPQVVQQKPVQFCLHLDVSPDADERKVMAEVIWRFQEYLTPTLHFHTFKQMRNLGLRCDEIYDGPLLQNGFLDNAELEQAQLLSEFYHSDLVRIAMETAGVLGVRELKVKEWPEEPGATFGEKAVYKIKKQGDNQSAPFVKRVIDLCDSCFYVSKGAITGIKMSENALHEHIEWLNLTQNCAVCAEPGGHLPEGGIHRSDLSDYRSVQYDLPDIYTVGDNTLPNDTAPLRRAQARQLQAYLAFFDQILAAYLAQLGQVNQLLSIDQDPLAATRLLPALYEVPGIRELIENQAAFEATQQDWTLAIGQAVPEPERVAVRTALGNMAQNTTQFTGFYAFRTALYQALDPKQYEVYAGGLQDYFWAKYAADPSNNYQKALLAAAETPAHRRAHRDRLLDHLLARFGESFTDYVHALLMPDGEPEDTPWRQDFDSYLSDKARFLREVAQLSHDRGRGYNYRKLNPVNHQPDVWLTNNVAGVKKRVSRLTGIDDFSQRSLIAEPPYRLDIVSSQTKQGTAQYRIVLKRRLIALDALDNPIQAGPILFSLKYNSQKKAQEKVTELYKNIWKSNLYKAEVSAADPDKWVVRFTLTDNELISDLMGEEEAKRLLVLLQDLVQPGKGEVEGFHLIEHILLRPNDPKDKLLQIPLGCDPKETPYDPYSFWLTVVLPNWTSRFKHADFRYFFEQTFRAETPSHIAIRFCWIDLNDMYLFEDAYRKWLIEKAKCSPSECHVTDAANALIDLLNTMPCTCLCDAELPSDKCVGC